MQFLRCGGGGSNHKISAIFLFKIKSSYFIFKNSNFRDDFLNFVRFPLETEPETTKWRNRITTHKKPF